MTPKIKGVKKLINLGKKEVIFVPKKLFKQKSKIPKKKNKAPIIREVFLLIWILDFGKSNFLNSLFFLNRYSLVVPIH